MKKTFIKHKLKKWVFACLLSGISLAGYSQYTLTIGPRAGANFSTLRGLSHAEMKTCFSGGVFLLYSAREHWGFSADLLYSGKGTRYNASSRGTTPVPQERKISLNYIELPLLVNYFFMDNGDVVRPKVMLGPSVSYLLSGKETGTGSGSAQFNKFDVGLVAGLGLNVQVATRMWINVDARYTHGLVDINKNNTLGTDDVKSRTISVLLGLGIGIAE